METALTAYERDRSRIESAAIRSARTALIASTNAITSAILRGLSVQAAANALAEDIRPSLKLASVTGLLQGRLRSIVAAKANQVPISIRDGGRGRSGGVLRLAVASGPAGRRRPVTINQLAQEALAVRLGLSGVEERQILNQAEVRAGKTAQELANQAARVAEAIALEIADDPMPTAQAVMYIRNRLAAAGLTVGKPYTIETIYRTAIQTAYSAGRWQANQDPAIQEVLWGYQYSAVMDDRTTTLCGTLDGLVRPKDDPMWERLAPPNHYNCRSDLIEVFVEDAPRVLAPIPSVTIDPNFAVNWGTLLRAA